jgi:PA14 domain
MKLKLVTSSTLMLIAACGSKTTFGAGKNKPLEGAPKVDDADAAALPVKVQPSVVVSPEIKAPAVEVGSVPVPVAPPESLPVTPPEPTPAPVVPTVQPVAIRTPIPIVCPVALFQSLTKLAVKRDSVLELPQFDAPQGRPLRYTAVGTLPAGTNLVSHVFSVANSPRPTATRASLKVSLADGACDAPIDVDILADGVLITDTVLTRGARGVFFPLKLSDGLRITLPGGSFMPDFDRTTPMDRKSIYVPTLDLTCPEFMNLGCPGKDGFIIEGYRDLKQDFGIRFTNRLVIETEGTYTFGTHSDDGSSVRLMDGPGLTAPIYVVENGNDHNPEFRTGQPIHLKKGTYRMVTDFYQGPIGMFALQVSWKMPGAATFRVIPSDALLVEEEN